MNYGRDHSTFEEKCVCIKKKKTRRIIPKIGYDLFLQDSTDRLA